MQPDMIVSQEGKQGHWSQSAMVVGNLTLNSLVLSFCAKKGLSNQKIDGHKYNVRTRLLIIETGRLGDKRSVACGLDTVAIKSS
jgi:hypothetical protein